MKADLVIGVDCSTTCCKAIVWNLDGKKVSEGRSNLEISTPKPLWYEQSAVSWWHGTVKALEIALHEINLNRLVAICIAHQRETFVPVDESGLPLRNAILWMDGRAGKQISYLSDIFGKDRFHKLTGKPISSNLSVTKLVWLLENEPEVFNKTNKFLDVQAFLVYHLTSKYCTGWGSADPMGLFDMTQNQWAFELLQRINILPNQLPDALPAGLVIGEITPNSSKECGLPVGLPVVAGIGDGQSAGLGSKVTDSKSAYICLGTSIISGYFASSYQVSKNFRTMYGGKKDTYFLETVILGGSYTINWFLEKVLRVKNNKLNKTKELLENLAKDLPAGAQGLLLVPYLNSAMNPYWDEKASGMLIGLRDIHGDGHIYRAILEGIAFEQRLHTIGVESILGNEVENFVVVGGGANSDLWCQIFADVTGKPVQRALEREATALGAGILAATALGFYTDPQEASESMVHLENNIFNPRKEQHKHYSRIFEDVYRYLYPALKERLSILSEC